MKVKLLISSLLLGTAILALAKGDPVLMTINGKDIKLSEFEYLYHKNNQQQVEKETLEQFVERFVLYKQKVAEAEAAGIDTTQSFIKEFEGYQKELAAPYLTEDTSYLWHFINEAYDRYKKEINIDHFMLPLGENPAATQENMILMDSIRNCVLAGEKWEDLADNYSSDPSKPRNHGHYGFVTSGMFPYDFENILYSTNVGEVSKPFATQFGVHMIRVNDIRDRNDVHARHILKLFPRDREVTAEDKALCKAQIDSIYNLLLAGADFQELARKESMDGTARRGGDLGWFGRGRMVQPFEDIAFDLPDGAISEPFETQFGYHIIQKVAHGMPSIDEIRGNFENVINRDERAKLIHEHRLGDLKAKCNYRTNPELDDYLTSALADAGKLDSAFIAKYVKGSTMPLFTYGKDKTVTIQDLASSLNSKAVISDTGKAKTLLLSKIDELAENKLAEYNGRELLLNNPEYKNLLNEYRDGMMLFEISNRRVWKAASKDTVGLEQFYAEHHADYTWDEPHFKGIILSAKNDSVLNLVKGDLRQYGIDALIDSLYKKYGNDIRMERMVVKRGENPYADYLAFNVGEKPERKNYSEFMIIKGGIINQPEEMADVRGAVTSDYQDVLEQRWKEELAKKYPAKINKKVLKKVK